MKPFILFAFLSIALFSSTNGGSPEPLNIDYQLVGEMFVAITDDSDDRLVSIKVYDSGNVLRAEKSCNLSMQCTINLAPLPAGNYNVKVASQYDNISVPVTLS